MDISGAWELDKERSQSMYPHMRLLGCDEIAALASEKLNLKLHIVQSANRINVWQQSQLGVVYRALHIGQDTEERSSQGERSVWVAVSADEVVVDTKFKTGRLLDTRRIDVDPETGVQVLTTCLQLTMRGQGGSTKTTRFFKRLGDPDVEVTGLPVESIATMAGLPYEKVGEAGAAKLAQQTEDAAAAMAAASALQAQQQQQQQAQQAQQQAMAVDGH